MIYAQMLDIVAMSDLASVLCARKFSFVTQGDLLPKITRLLAKMALLSLYFHNRASDFDDFCTDVRDSWPEWFGLSAVCEKILVCPPGGDLPPNDPGIAKMA